MSSTSSHPLCLLSQCVASSGDTNGDSINLEHKAELPIARWLVEQKDPLRNEEMYRLIADTGGACVQPALFKAFGLAVIKDNGFNSA
ncbi:Sucrose-cleaving enzyme [Trebouxia sp. C0009 RCD-2024]